MTLPESPETKPDTPATIAGVPVGTPAQRSGLMASLYDGIFASGMTALTDTFGIAAALSLRAPVIVYGILGSLPVFIGTLLQTIMPSLCNTGRGRRRYIVRGVAVQATAAIACGMAGFLAPSIAPWAFLCFFVLYGLSGSAFGGLWTSWMKDLSLPETRGRHFAFRNRVFAAVQLVCMIGTGLLARHYTAGTAPWIFYAVVFCAAGIFRFISMLFMTVQYEEIRPTLPKVKHPFDFTIPKNLVLFAVSTALLQGAAAMSGPFFNVWYLRDLHFSYLMLAISSAAPVLGTIIFLPLWGKIADRIGQLTLLKISSVLLITIPIPYLFTENHWVICMLNFYSGTCWSAFNLTNFNFMMESAGEKDTDRRIALVGSFTGLSLFLSGFLGGWLATRLPELFGWQLRSLFALSSLLRVAIVLLLFLRIRPAHQMESTSP